MTPYRHETAHFPQSCFVFGLVFFRPLDFALSLDLVFVRSFSLAPRPGLDFFLRDLKEKKDERYEVRENVRERYEVRENVREKGAM